jgi:large subunit ribosomal protein L18
MRETLQNRSDKRAAAVVGRAIAARAKSADVPAVHFAKPRGAQRKRFHGKLKALIDAMREAGLPLNFATLAPR